MALHEVLPGVVLGNTTSLSREFSYIPMLGLFLNEVQYELGPSGWCRMQGAVNSRGSGRPGSHPG